MDSPIDEVQKALALSSNKSTSDTNQSILEGLTLRSSLEATESARQSNILTRATNRLAIIMVVIGLIQLGGLAYQVFSDYRVDCSNVVVQLRNVPVKSDNLEEKKKSIAEQSSGNSLKSREEPIPSGEVGQ